MSKKLPPTLVVSLQIIIMLPLAFALFINATPVAAADIFICSQDQNEYTTQTACEAKCPAPFNCNKQTAASAPAPAKDVFVCPLIDATAFDTQEACADVCADDCVTKTLDAALTDKDAEDAAAKAVKDSSKATPTDSGSALALPVPLAGIDPPKLIGRIIQSLLGVIGSIALLMFVWGGFQWMTAAGNSKKTESARATLVWAAIGMVVIFASYALVNFVLNTIAGATGN